MIRKAVKELRAPGQPRGAFLVQLSGDGAERHPIFLDGPWVLTEGSVLSGDVVLAVGSVSGAADLFVAELTARQGWFLVGIEGVVSAPCARAADGPVSPDGPDPLVRSSA